MRRIRERRRVALMTTGGGGGVESVGGWAGGGGSPRSSFLASFDWFNAELSPETHWRGPTSQEMGRAEELL